MLHISKKQVEAQNSINAILNEIAPQLLKVVADSIGEKIVKVDGDLTKKFASKLDVITSKFHRLELEGYNYGYAKIHYIHVRKEYSTLSLKISGIFQDSVGSCFYRDAQIYLGKMELNGASETGVLKNIYDFTRAISYDYDEQQLIIKQIQDAEQVVRDLKRRQMKGNF